MNSAAPLPRVCRTTVNQSRMPAIQQRLPALTNLQFTDNAGQTAHTRLGDPSALHVPATVL